MENTKVVPSVDYTESSHSCSAAGLLQTQVCDIRKTKINWSSYVQTQIISNEHYQFIVKYDRAQNTEARNAVINQDPNNTARILIYLINKISNVETIQYLLTLIDDMLQEDKQRVEIFRNYFIKIKDSMMDNFFAFLRQDNKFIIYQSSRIITKIACWSTQLLENKDVKYFFRWTEDQLLVMSNDYIQTVTKNLQMILRVRQYRRIFVECDGIQSIVKAITETVSSQIQYQLIFCLWCLSFDADIGIKMIKTPNLIVAVSDIVRQTEREKIIRISLAFFRFLIEKLTNQSLIREVALAMVQCKILKHLEMLQQKDYSHDPELTEDLAYLTEKLSSNVQDVSSLEEYVIELRSGRLEWSPVHKAEKFWRENADKFIDKNYELLKMLVRLLETSKDALTLQIAIHDIGEFVRHYARGKQVIEKLGGKGIVMDFLNDSDDNVKYHALISLQKIMVHNWEYLGKQVDSTLDQRQDKTDP